MDKISRWLLKVLVVLIIILFAVQIGIYEGRRMERHERENYPLPVINALLHTDGYTGSLAQREGSLRIVYSLAALKEGKE